MVEHVFQFPGTVQTFFNPCQVKIEVVHEGACEVVNQFLRNSAAGLVTIELPKHALNQPDTGSTLLVLGQDSNASELDFVFGPFAKGDTDSFAVVLCEEQDVFTHHETGHRLVDVPVFEAWVIVFNAAQQIQGDYGVSQSMGAFIRKHDLIPELTCEV
jgi:hypothetical protein